MGDEDQRLALYPVVQALAQQVFAGVVHGAGGLVQQQNGRVEQQCAGQQNSLALAAACAALDDVDYLAASRRVNDAGMAQLERGFRQLGLEWIPSRGNFIAVDFARDAAPINQALLREGVIVRPVAGYGMPTFLRVSIGTERENARFLDVLAQVLQQ